MVLGKRKPSVPQVLSGCCSSTVFTPLLLDTWTLFCDAKSIGPVLGLSHKFVLLLCSDLHLGVKCTQIPAKVPSVKTL